MLKSQCKAEKQQFNEMKNNNSIFESPSIQTLNNLDLQLKHNSNVLFILCACLPIFIKCLKNKLLV